MQRILSSSPTIRTYSSVSRKTYGGKRSSGVRENWRNEFKTWWTCLCKWPKDIFRYSSLITKCTHSGWHWWKRPLKFSPLLWPELCRHSQHWSWAGGRGWEYRGGGKLWSSCLEAHWCRCPCGGLGLWLQGRWANRAVGSLHPPSSPPSGIRCWSRTHGLDLVKKELETVNHRAMERGEIYSQR